MASRLAIRFVIAILVFPGWTPAQVADNLSLVNENGSEQSGFIVWANGKSQQVFGHTVVGVGDLQGDDNGQIVGFTVDRPPVLLTAVRWTASNNFITLTYPNVYEIPVKFWILCAQLPCNSGLPADLQTRLDGFLVFANERLRAERVGVRLVRAGDDWISDQTAATGGDIGKLRKFKDDDCTTVESVMQGMKLQGAFNVYMVQLVNWRKANGHTCETDDSVIVGREASWDTMLHEMGHDLSLGHVEETVDTWFNDVGGEENLMCKFSDARRYLTEGQVFRMHFARTSGLNGSLKSHVNPQPVPMDCLDDADFPCPYVQTLLWEDK